ncbi:hypothetical protein LTR62_002959 [Meristemomyces frigidus]|uniref:Major facilitator superfamily (MFS) profile domain-containing protein n=1 Tax=Meristemomyces frigidus TaxID=1508187 RepID=A0AAN7YUH3_9PEZI|nr:hypothetical protein LTR62_002959 [Meristemomyces frigidus]
MSSRPRLYRLIVDQTLITDDVRKEWTADDPYVVDWIPNDPLKGFNYSPGLKWVIVMICAFSTLATSMSATLFAGAIPQLMSYFEIAEEVATLTVCLFVLGFALGPVVWGPLSELYARQAIYLVTMGGSVVFEGPSIACHRPDVAALLVLRFLAGAFSSAAIANSPAIVSDLFIPAEQGIPIMAYMMFPFLGPTLGPICGNFFGAGAGWRWVNVLCALCFAVMFTLGLIFLPETYAPYMLRRRAAALSKATGDIYISKLDVAMPPKRLGATLSTAIQRPLVMLVTEPISTALAIWAALIYGTL